MEMKAQTHFFIRAFTAAAVFLAAGIAGWNPAFAAAREAMRLEVGSQRLSPDLEKTLKSLCEQSLEKYHSPGMAAGVVQGYTLVFECYAGYADQEAKKPVSEDTFFRIGSISKSMTAAGLLKLWEQGKVNLHEDVNHYLDQPLFFPPHPEERPATLFHLLTHTSGAGEFLSIRQLFMKGQGIRVEGDNYLPLEHYLELGFHTKLDPGIKWAYSNYGYALIGFAVERISGKPFHEYMKEEIFLPLGMKETAFQHRESMLSRIVTGYTYGRKKKSYRRRKHQAYGATPPGNVYTTAREFALYLAALLNGGANRLGRILKPDTVRLMMKSHHTYDPRQSAYGFGFFIYGEKIWGRFRVVGHSGSVPFGHTSQMLMVPAKRIGVFAFGNTDTRAPINLAWEMLKVVLNAESRPLPKVEPDRDSWNELCGWYGPEFPDFKTSTRLYMSNVGRWHVKREGNSLLLIPSWQGKKKARELHQVSPSDPWFFWYENEKSPLGGSYVSFQKGPDGEIYLVPGGLTRLVKLGPARSAKAVFMIPLGRVLAEINPF